MSSPLSVQLVELCDAELFTESIQNSEITSCSNSCYEELPDSARFSLPEDLQNFGDLLQEDLGINTNLTAITPTMTTGNATTAAAINNDGNQTANIHLQDVDINISASIDFSPSPPFLVSSFICSQQDHLMMDFRSEQVTENQLPLTNGTNGLSNFTGETVSPLIGPQLIASKFKQDCLSSVPPSIPLDPAPPSCFFVGPMRTYMPGNMTGTLSADRSGIFLESVLKKPDLPARNLEYHVDNNGEMSFSTKEFCSESEKLVKGNWSSAPFTTDISNLEDPTYQLGKISVEQRKEKIRRYMKKRNERNFSKKIKYACRKTLADSRPRVRGRFAKNNEFGENLRLLEDDEKDEVVMKEDDMMDSSDIFAHIGGVNSFNYSIQSWI